MAPAEELFHKAQEYIGSARGAIAILVAAITLVVWAVRQEGRITTAAQQVQSAQDRLNDIDVHGTRAMAERLGALAERVSVVEKRMNVGVQVLQEQDTALTHRIEAIEPAARATDVLASKLQDMQRRVDQIEKETGALDVLNVEVTRLREQLNRQPPK